MKFFIVAMAIVLAVQVNAQTYEYVPNPLAGHIPLSLFDSYPRSGDCDGDGLKEFVFFDHTREEEPFFVLWDEGETIDFVQYDDNYEDWMATDYYCFYDFVGNQLPEIAFMWYDDGLNWQGEFEYEPCYHARAIYTYVPNPMHTQVEAIQMTPVLMQNYPNPFNDFTNIPFILNIPAEVELSVFNMMGRLVDQRNLGAVLAGEHVITLQNEKFSSGKYWYQLKAGNTTTTKQFTFIR